MRLTRSRQKQVASDFSLGGEQELPELPNVPRLIAAKGAKVRPALSFLNFSLFLA
jgi:hypothetical protein